VERWQSWIVAIIAALAIVALIAFARGTPNHGEENVPTHSSSIVVLA
jgi:hypothetical protein